MTFLNNFSAMLSLFQGEHMIFILIAVLLLFGGRKIPELMRGIGKGMREFKDAKDNVRSEIEMGMTDKEKDEEIVRLRREAERARLQQQSTAQQTNVQQP